MFVIEPWSRSVLRQRFVKNQTQSSFDLKPKSEVKLCKINNLFRGSDDFCRLLKILNMFLKGFPLEAKNAPKN